MQIPEVEIPESIASGEDNAVEVALYIDPYFYDSAKTKYSYGTIMEDVNDFATPKGKGFIYVETDTFGETVIIDGIANLTGLVFKDFYPAEAAAPFDPYDSTDWPVINGRIQIINKPTFTLLGFVINAGIPTHEAVLVQNPTGSGTLILSYLEINNSATSSALSVEHTGNIKISEVKATSTGGHGATFGNAVAAINAEMTITNSSFNNSGKSGLRIRTEKTLTLNGVSTSYNLDSKAEISSRGVTVKNSVFSDNGNAGSESGFAFSPVHLSANGTGKVTFENVQANNNYYAGIWAKVYGNVAIKNMRANNNGTYGAYIDTLDGGNNPGSGNIITCIQQPKYSHIA